MFLPSIADLETRQLVAILLIILLLLALTIWGLDRRAKARHRKERMRGSSAAKRRETSGK